jgi:hypothetical protein
MIMIFRFKSSAEITQDLSVTLPRLHRPTIGYCLARKRRKVATSAPGGWLFEAIA